MEDLVVELLNKATERAFGRVRLFVEPGTIRSLEPAVQNLVDRFMDRLAARAARQEGPLSPADVQECVTTEHAGCCDECRSHLHFQESEGQIAAADPLGIQLRDPGHVAPGAMEDEEPLDLR